MKEIVIISGPTAAGKSDLAIALSKQKNGAVISADSMQVYKGMDIGTAKITEEEKRGVIDTTGKLVVPMEYDFVLPFVSDGRVAVFKDDHSFVSDGQVIVFKDDKFGVFNFDGQMILPPENDYISRFYEGLAAVKKDGKWGYVDVSGQIVIPLEYDRALSFCNGFAAVFKDGKWGYIDRSGAVVIPIEYDSCTGSTLLGQVALVKKGQRWGIVCLTGNE